MANETKNQEFNKSIKQLQSMVKDKMLINLAERYFNLKTEMNNLARAVKEKETKLLIEESKQQALKEQVSQIQETKPEIVSAPQKPEVVIETQKTKQENNVNKNQNFSKQHSNSNNNRNNYNKNYNTNNPNNFNKDRRPFNNRLQNQNNQNRPFNSNKPNQNYKPGQRPSFNKDNLNKRPSINYTQPVITANPARNFGNKKKDNERGEEKRAYSKRDLIKRGMLDFEDTEDRMVNRKIRPKKKEVIEKVIEK